MSIALALLATVVMLPTADLPLNARIVEAGGVIYSVGEAEFVVSGATKAQWSPDGRQLLVQYLDPPNDALGRAPSGQETVLALWGVQSHKFDGGSIRMNGRRNLEPRWEGPSGNVYFENDEGYFRLNAKGLQKLNITLGGNVSIGLSSDHAGILLNEYVKSTGQFESTSYLIPPDRTERVKIPPPADVDGCCPGSRRRRRTPRH